MVGDLAGASLFVVGSGLSGSHYKGIRIPLDCPALPPPSKSLFVSSEVIKASATFITGEPKAEVSISRESFLAGLSVLEKEIYKRRQTKPLEHCVFERSGGHVVVPTPQPRSGSI